jgi:hypothetical protein
MASPISGTVSKSMSATHIGRASATPVAASTPSHLSEWVWRRSKTLSKS